MNGFSVRSRLGVWWTRDQILKVSWVIAALALGAESHKGADYPRYAQWVEAFESYNVLKVRSTVLSPVGVPVSHWSHAPALITNAIDRLLELLPFVETGLHTVSWLATLALWWALFGLARLAARGDTLVFVFALAAAFVGTHTGFYSTHHSSEVFSLASLAVASYWAFSAGPERLRDTLLIGIACGLLLVVRVNLLMYLPLPILARASCVWRARGGRLNRAVVLHALVLGVPLVAFGVQVLFFNYWMTGSPSRSPYVYGDAGFRSVDFAHPLFGTTLFHAWHGLLTYHPFYALGPVALVALAARRSLPLTERALAGGALLALLSHLYLQASWWCWWNGTGTFGNRTLAVGGVIVVIAVARWLALLLEEHDRWQARVGAAALLAVSALSCVWSLLLFLQGHSNFQKWDKLLDAQRGYLLDHNVLAPLVISALLAIGFAFVARREQPDRAVAVALTGFITTLAAQAVCGSLLTGWCERHLETFTPVVLALFSAGVFALFVRLAAERSAPPNPTALARHVMVAALLWTFLAGSWAFAKLASATKDVIADSKAPARKYAYRSTMVIDDIVDSVREYDEVEGFNRRKLAAKHFIDATVEETRRR